MPADTAVLAAPPPPTAEHRSIYRGIVHSTALLGAVRVLTVFVNFARYKALAIVLGPAGVGIFGMFDALVTTSVTTSSLGVNVSGIREVASAGAKGQRRHLEIALASLGRLVWLLAIGGALAVALFSGPIGRTTFGQNGYGTSVAIAGLAVLFVSLQCGYRAKLQGLNRIRGLARAMAVIAVTDTAIIVAAAAIWGRAAIAPGLAASGLVGAIIMAVAARTPEFRHVRISWREFARSSRGLITLGVSLAAAMFLSSNVTYGIRTLINREIGLTAAGLYVAAFALSGKSIGFLLDSMRADLYPRLSATADDNGRLNQLVNGQTEICLLITSPAILVMIGLAPWLVRLFYSGDFAPAATLLAWFSLGSLSRVIATPLGYVRLAKGRSVLYFLTELAFAGLQVALAVGFIVWRGLTGAVIAFTLAATVQMLGLAWIAHRMTGFRWSRECLRLFAATLPVTGAVFVFCQFGPPLWGAALSVAAAVGLACYNVRELVDRLGPEHRISRTILRLPGFGRLAASVR